MAFSPAPCRHAEVGIGVFFGPLFFTPSLCHEPIHLPPSSAAGGWPSKPVPPVGGHPPPLAPANPIIGLRGAFKSIEPKPAPGQTEYGNKEFFFP